jgi:NAD(P)-dependent dehydrogenase (short-subunit alcohol dehydrogenase family)/acyl dehydratase
VTTLRLDHDHVQRFAAASGDVNPLHLDPDFARRSVYGRCIAHGALVAIAALGHADQSVLGRTRSLDLRFVRPVFPGEELTVRAGLAAAGRVTVEAWSRGQLTTRITVEAEASDLPAAPHCPQSGQGEAQRLTLAQVAATPGADHGGGYAPDLGGLRTLAADLGAGKVPDPVLAWLAAASYTVGMLVPGVDAVFVGARIERADTSAPGHVSAIAGRSQPSTGLLGVQAWFGYGPASARLGLQAIIRSRVPGPRRDVLTRHLPPSDGLAGRQVLVVGGSRGLGAAITAALASQGATAWAGYARSAGPAAELRGEFGAESIRPVQFDAADAGSTRVAIEKITAEAGMLDGVVLCAAPPLDVLPLRREAMSAALAYVEQSMAMTLHPLAEVLPHIAPGGWLAFISSSFVAEPPAEWPHYVAAKGAIESLAAYCRKHSGLHVVTIRPTRMWTDMTNGPTGSIGMTAVEEVAAAIVRWVLDHRSYDPILDDQACVVVGQRAASV